MEKKEKEQAFSFINMVAGFPAGLIPLATSFLLPDQVANWMGSHATRAEFEHASEAVLMPLFAVSLVECFFFSLGKNKPSKIVTTGMFITLWGLFQIVNESHQAEILNRPLQTDQLLSTFLGFIIGAGLIFFANKFEKVVLSKT